MTFYIHFIELLFLLGQELGFRKTFEDTLNNSTHSEGVLVTLSATLPELCCITSPPFNASYSYLNVLAITPVMITRDEKCTGDRREKAYQIASWPMLFILYFALLIS